MADWRIHGAPLALALLLGACNAGADGADAAPSAEGETIACAIGTATQFAETCRVEREVVDGALNLVIHHEDGGFRRLTVMTDGSGVITADGADPARISVFDGQIEVAVGADRYILPATIGPATGSTSDAQ